MYLYTMANPIIQEVGEGVYRLNNGLYSSAQGYPDVDPNNPDRVGVARNGGGYIVRPTLYTEWQRFNVLGVSEPFTSSNELQRFLRTFLFNGGSGGGATPPTPPTDPGYETYTQYTDLPETTDLPIGTLAVVEQDTFDANDFITAPAGWYIRDALSGDRGEDWRKVDYPFKFSDGPVELRNDADTSKIATFDASQIPTGTTNAYTLPSSSGTFALLSDITGGTEIATLQDFSPLINNTGGFEPFFIQSPNATAGTVTNGTWSYTPQQTGSYLVRCNITYQYDRRNRGALFRVLVNSLPSNLSCIESISNIRLFGGVYPTVVGGVVGPAVALFNVYEFTCTLTETIDLTQGVPVDLRLEFTPEQTDNLAILGANLSIQFVS